jgi:hypothetical protein
MIIKEIKEDGFSIGRENDPRAKTIIIKRGINAKINRAYDNLPALIQLLILMILVGSQMIFTHYFGNIGYIYWSIPTLIFSISRFIYIMK